MKKRIYDTEHNPTKLDTLFSKYISISNATDIKNQIIWCSGINVRNIINKKFQIHLFHPDIIKDISISQICNRFFLKVGIFHNYNNLIGIENKFKNIFMHHFFQMIWQLSC